MVCERFLQLKLDTSYLADLTFCRATCDRELPFDAFCSGSFRLRSSNFPSLKEGQGDFVSWLVKSFSSSVFDLCSEFDLPEEQGECVSLQPGSGQSGFWFIDSFIFIWHLCLASWIQGSKQGSFLRPRRRKVFPKAGGRMPGLRHHWRYKHKVFWVRPAILQQIPLVAPLNKS